MRLKIVRLNHHYVLHPASMFYSLPDLDWLSMLPHVVVDNTRSREQVLLISRDGTSIPVPFTVLVTCSQAVRDILAEDPRIEDIAITMGYDAETVKAFQEFLLSGETTVRSNCMRAELEEIWSILGMPNSVLGECGEMKNAVGYKYQSRAPVEREDRTRNGDDGDGDLFQLIDQWAQFPCEQSSPEAIPNLNLSNNVDSGLRSDERDADPAPVANANYEDPEPEPALEDAALPDDAQSAGLVLQPVPRRQSLRISHAARPDYRHQLADQTKIRNLRVDINKTLANSYLPSNTSFSSLLVQENKFKCDNCENTFKIRSALNRHLNRGRRCSVQSCIHTCDDCNKSFTWRSSLEKHQKIEHKGIISECLHCSESYKYWHQLAKHMREEHKEMLPQCEICYQHFQSEGILKKHKRVEHNTTQPDETYCSQCSVQFKTTGSLRNHVKFQHSTKFLSCELCSFTTKYPHLLRRHMKRQHRMQIV